MSSRNRFFCSLQRLSSIDAQKKTHADSQRRCTLIYGGKYCFHVLPLCHALCLLTLANMLGSCSKLFTNRKVQGDVNSSPLQTCTSSQFVTSRYFTFSAAKSSRTWPSKKWVRKLEQVIEFKWLKSTSFVIRFITSSLLVSLWIKENTSKHLFGRFKTQSYSTII